MVNGSPRPVTFTIPETGKPCSWHTELDSSDLAADITTPEAAGATGTTGTARTGTPTGPDDPAHIGAGDHLVAGNEQHAQLGARAGVMV